jgi:hypothetical protein
MVRDTARHVQHAPFTEEKYADEERRHSSLPSFASVTRQEDGVFRRVTSAGIWGIPLRWRRRLVLVGSIGMTALAGGLFAPGFFWGKVDWVVAVGGALLGGLCRQPQALMGPAQSARRECLPPSPLQIQLLTSNEPIL